MLKSFRFAGEGMAWMLKNHPNTRVFFSATVVVILAGMFLKITRTDFIVLLLTILMTLMAEMLNTALEEITNLITVKWSAHAKVAKDVGAAMSLTASILSVLIGIVIFAPYIQAYIK